jgi:type III pantothenate kinase
MRLLIDLGNSRLKWVLSDTGEWRTGALAYRGHDVTQVLDDAWAVLPAPTTVVMASVAADGTRRSVETWIESHWRVRSHRVEARPEQLGVVNAYRDPATLGADRWAALIGARAEVPASAAAIVNCGTAVTVDALSAGGEFVGGIIFPGLALLQGALATGTAGVRAMPGDETSCLARSTADAVAAGTLYGLAGAIERVCSEFEQALGEPLKVLITGGDADRVAPHLIRPARRIPDLVLKGLERIAATL